MDLSTIEQKLDDSKYKSINDVSSANYLLFIVWIVHSVYHTGLFSANLILHCTLTFLRA